MDHLKELSSKLGGKVVAQNHLNINFYEKSYRKILVKNYNGYKLKVYEFGKLFLLYIYVESDFSFSINNPDIIFFFDKALTLGDLPYKVYVSSEEHGFYFDKRSDSFWNRFFTRIKDIQLRNNETVFVYRNCIAFALESSRDLLMITNDIIDLLNSYNAVFRKKIDTKIISKNVPDNLRVLLPLIKKWSISDDAEREQLIEKTSERQKQKLIDTVDPLMREINTFLNSFNDQPLNDEAMLIGNLAELVSELKLNSQDAGSVN